MRKDRNMEFVACHSCDNQMDVSKESTIFDRDSSKQIIKHVCKKCGSLSQLVISMLYGLTSIERINKRRVPNKKRPE